MRLSPETCRVKPLWRIKTQLLHLVGLISLLLITGFHDDDDDDDDDDSDNDNKYRRKGHIGAV